MDRITLRLSPFGGAAVVAAALVALGGSARAQGGVAYMYETSRAELAHYDLATGARRTVTEGLAGAGQVAVHGRLAWVVEEDSGELSTVDLSTGVITTVATGLGRPFGLALRPENGGGPPRVAYVAEGRWFATGQNGRLLAVDLATGSSTIVATGIAWAGGNIAIHPDGTTVYGAPERGWDNVIAIDVGTGAPSGLVPFLWSYYQPDRAGVELSPDGQTLFFDDGGVSGSVALSSPSSPPTYYGWSTDSLMAISPDGSRVAVRSRLALEEPSLVTDLDWSSGPQWWVQVRASAYPFRAASFLDADTLLLTNVAGLFSLDVASGALRRVDRGLPRLQDIDVVGSTAYVIDPDRRRVDVWRAATGSRAILYPPRVLSVDVATGELDTVFSDVPWDFLSCVHASRDGAHLYFGRSDGSPGGQLVDIDLASGFVRPIGSFQIGSAPNFSVDDAEGYAYVADPRPGVALARVHLATGLTTDEFVRRVGDTIPYLSDVENRFGVDFAAGRLMAKAWNPVGPPGVAVGAFGLAAGEVWQQETELLFPARVYGSHVRATADARGLYAWALTSVAPEAGSLVHVDMVSAGHPQTVLLTTDRNVSTFCVLNTADGANVVATPTDPVTGTSPVTLTFDNVTAAGDTTVTTSTTGPAIPSGFQLGGAGVYYEVTTTADFAGNVEICIDYTGTTFVDETTLQLLHYEHGQWVNVTTTRDPATNRICGVVRSFSPFVVVEWPAMSALNDLLNRVHNLDIRHGIVVSLDAKLTAVQDALWYSLQGNRSSAANCLRAFIQEVRAQSGRSLPVDVADGLIADAEAILALLGG
ncbi:MAG: hypothetical protein IPM29_24485 [Planctomycetes bacterium]|nr:hypothetical protein [Planctomycetota bacterium]